MKKKINIIVRTEKLNNLEKGSITTVARGYALNYLIPNRMAEMATEGKTKQIEMFKAIRNKKEEAKSINELLIQKNLKRIKKICIYKKKGEGNLIFGSVTEKDIKNCINRYSNIDTNSLQFKLNDSKQIGHGNIEIIISSKISTIIPLHLMPINI